MSERVVSLTRDKTVREAISTMRKHGIHDLAVMEDKTLEGWVSYADILRRGGLPNDAKVTKVMVSPPKLDPKATPIEAAELMVRTNSKTLPVVDAKGHVVGVLSRTDLLKAALEYKDITKQKLEKVMTRDLEVVADSDAMDKVEHKLNELHMNQFLVVDDAGKLVGYVSTEELAGARHAEGPKERATGFADRTMWSGRGPGRRKELSVNVGSLAKPAPTLRRDDSLGDAIRTMIDEHTWFVAVADGRLPVGVVSRSDVLARLAAQRPRDGVMVQVSGLGQDIDQATYSQIYSKSQAVLSKMAEQDVRLEFLGLHYKTYHAKSEGDVKYSLTAHLSTQREFLVAKANAWDLLAATDGALDILQSRVRNAQELKREKRKGGSRRAAAFYRHA